MEKNNTLLNPLLRWMAEGPIEWKRWNTETLKRAGELDRPLCVCVVSSTSRWSYAMKENFDEPEIVKMLNNDFIPVLCDTSAAPHLTLAAKAMAQIMLGHAGWPLFLFMTPQREPIFASSYMPKQSADSRVPGLLDVLRRIKWLWLMKRPQINEAAKSYAVQMKEALSPYTAPVQSNLASRASSQLMEEADRSYGGWGEAPKSPQAPKLLLSAWLCRTMPDGEKELPFLRRTVAAICCGGLYDHLGGGFHDYCRDREWLQPYLGKHAGQNTALLAALLECWRVLKDDGLLNIIESSIAWMLKNLDNGEGLFLSGEDLSRSADVDAYYLWKKDDADAVLKSDSALLGMSQEGNYPDPLTRKPTGMNLPFWGGFSDAHSSLGEAEERLREAQNARPLPPLENKVLLRDNACMAAVLARGARHAERPEWLTASEKIMTQIEKRMILDGSLVNALYDSQPEGSATLDDLSVLVWAYIELHRSTGRQHYLDAAASWAKKCDELFGSDGAMQLTATSDHELLPAWDAGDDYMFSGAAVMLNNLVSLFSLSSDAFWKSRAERLIAAFGGALNEYPAACAGFTLGTLRLWQSTGAAKE